jgi:hypothetical protein
MRRFLTSALFAGALALQGLAPLAAQAVPPTPDQITAVSVAPTISPTPVHGTDGRVHLAYELLMVNFATAPATLVSVDALDADRPTRVLDSLSGADVPAHFKIAAIGTPTAEAAVIGAGQEAIVWLDASVPDGTPVPRAIVHRVHITYTEPQSGGLIPKDITVTVGRTEVSGIPTPIIAPPLRGANWFDANGCCSLVTAHRGSDNPLNGTTNFPERTAIDFVQLNGQDTLYTGPATAISSYAYYQTPIHAVADGEVIAVTDGLPNQVPTIEPPLGQLPLADFSGNHVVEKFEYAGHTFYSLYAHMAPGSVSARVHVGQHVRTGEVIGLLGNSGNSSAPHLHFQVMDSPTELASQGLPYEFDQFFLRGRGPSESTVDDVLSGRPFTFAPGVTPEWMCDRLPLNLDLVTFPERP